MDVDIMKRGVEKGACDFLIKLIRDDTLKMIWTSVFRSRLRNEGVIVNNDVISEVNQQERLDSPIQSTSDDSAMHGRSEGSSGMNRGRGNADYQHYKSNDSKDTKTTDCSSHKEAASQLDTRTLTKVC
ncbi:hypothetical protein CDL15_Pgr018657 [Punica granatum]|uniref:Response regulatory domain-containing protein n=1 Tax=Punica granatum TaxID=22663 RepID=A0A218WZT5_PUNGR|nr:hypothetical protein CDL15_Pgr018657 [Punica granatum]